MSAEIEVLRGSWPEYELLDSGDRLKLERFGKCVVVRGEPKAWWCPRRPELWKTADCRYLDETPKNAHWLFHKKTPAPVLDFEGVKLNTKFMEGSKHIGVFPEQSPHWEFIAQSAKKRTGEKPKLLNLFGYTGAATLVAAASGYAVTHVDASKPSVDWARRNQASSRLMEAPIRWIVDDAFKFVCRQQRKGARYDAIILDPPSFGRGPKGELWKLEKMLPNLLESCAAILSDNPMFVIITLYSIDASAIMAKNIIAQYFAKKGRNCRITCGELAAHSPKSFDLPLSIWAKADWTV